MTFSVSSKGSAAVSSDYVPAQSAAEKPKLLLTVSEAAARLGIGRTHMYALIGSGQIKSVLIGRLRRVRPADLETYTGNLSVAPIDQLTA